MPRYFAIAVVLTFIGFAIVGKAMYIMTAKKDYWTQVASRLKRDSVSVKPARGNILSCDGQLMATSIPEYKIYMDFQAGTDDSLGTCRRDSLWAEKIDTICHELSEIFPSKTATEFKTHLLEGKHKVMKNGKAGARHWAIWPKRIDYNTFCEVRKLPIFKEPIYKGGFHWEEFNSRRRPFGSLARRTVGDLFGAKDSAKYGLELSYDSILRGTNGLMHRRKVLSKYLDIPVMAPIDGADIVTTIDVGMQDLAERALIDELKEVNGEMGVAILMEVKTGDVEVSSNIGVSYVIDKFYGSNPTKYVQGLYRVGIHEDLKLPLVGYHPPYIRMPDTKTTDRAKYWSKTTLPWMSIGYETQIAPINTVAFYNAIANDGKMMQRDGIHPTDKGARQMAEIVAKAIKKD